MSLPPEGADGLTRQQQELYRVLLKKKGVDPSREPIRPRPYPAVPAPLSYAQQRLWFFHRLAPQSAAYNIPLVYRLRGPLDRGALERSFNEIIRRHDILRTTCGRDQGCPVQTVTSSLTIRLPATDLRETPEADRERLAQLLARDEARRPFDLDKGPLLRTTLLQIADDEHLLLLITHHFVSDGWSLRVWIGELCALYTGFRDGNPVQLGELPIQYPDYACWQRNPQRAAALEQEVAFWKERLRDAPKELPLPVDHHAPPKAVSPGASRRVVLSPELSGRLLELSREKGVTPYILLLAGFQTLLHRLSGIDAITVGTPVSTRTRVETENLIGNFANYLLLITDLGGDPTFGELLARVRTVASEAFANQELPPELLAEKLQATGQAHWIPALQVLFVVREGALGDMLRLPEITVSQIHVDVGAARVDLYLDLSVGEKGIGGTLIYNRDLFEPATVERMVDLLRLLLSRVAEQPARRVSELVTEDELIRGNAKTAASEAELPEFRVQRDELELQLRGIWEHVLDRGPLGADDDFFGLGGTSVLAMSLYAEIQQALGVTLPEDAIIRAPTIATLARLIRDGGWTSPWKHLVPLQSTGDRPGLFLIHGLEGGALPYALLTRHLGDERPVYALETTEIRDDEGFEDLARKYLSEIRAVQPSGPYHIGGHCTGGIVALELALQLHAAGQQVGLMAQMDPLFIPGGIRHILKFLRLRVRWRGFLKRMHDTAFGRAVMLVGRHRRRVVRADYRKGRVAFGEPNVDTVRLMEEHSRMRENYDLRPWHGHVHVFLSDSKTARKHDPVPIWQELAPNGLDVIKVPGRHVNMLAEPHVAVLAREVRKALAETESR